MAAINYCSTFHNENLANHFHSIIRRLANDCSISRTGDEYRVCFSVCIGSCDIPMVRDLAVRTCDGTFCNL